MTQGLPDAHLILKHSDPSPPVATATACLAGAGSGSKGWNRFQNIAIISVIPDISFFWHLWCDFCNFCVFLAFFCIFWVHFLGMFYVFNNEDFWCAFIFDFLCFIFIFLCTFFAFFASANRRRTYIRYRDNIGYPRYGESYNIGDNQYSSKNLSYCPRNRFLESVPTLIRFPLRGGVWAE